MSDEQKGFHDIVKKYIEDVPYIKSGDNIKELEIRFSNGKSRITKIDYDNVCRKLLSLGFKPNKNEGKYLLRISNEYTDRSTGRTKISNIRTEINNLDNVKEYCKTNKLPDDNRAYNYVQKSQAKDKNGAPLFPYDVKSYNLRLSYSLETNINKTSKLAQSINESWSDSKKVFRYINRVSFTHENFPLTVDCSIVKSSPRKGKYLLPTYTVQEADLFNNPETYEIEIEVDNSKMEGVNTNDLEKKLMGCIKFVLSGLQQTNYPVSYVEIDNIGKEYLKLIKNNSNYLKTNTFIGPNSFTLQMENIVEKNTDNNIPNIRSGYTVTDKADGLRKLLYISNKGLIYLINTNMNIEFTGSRCDNNNYYNSLIDGEHISHNKRDEFINLYAAFDVYFIKNVDVRAKAFVKKDTESKESVRLNLLSELVANIGLKGITNIEKPPIRIEIKNFYVSQGDVTIFAACKQILDRVKNNGFEYETDGLIFTPSDFGVGLTKLNTTLKSTKTSWEYSMKWKPSYYNTIDFYITTKKQENGTEIVGNIFEKGSNTTTGTDIVQYKTIILRVGFDEKRDGYINPCLDVINDNIPTFNSIDDNDTYKPMPFYPTNPYDSNAHICYIKLQKDNNGSLQMMTHENEVFTDNTIVEFSYDPTKEPGWRWTPLRVRWDKTAELRNGGRNYGNNYTVANNNWQSIHNPITDDMITGISNLPDDDENDTYYIKQQGESNTRALRDFHNLFVKKVLIKGAAQNGYTLIDLAVGKGGDFSKWIDAKLSFVFGIDLSKDNIENRLDGACARYLNYRKKFKVMPDALFVNGNSGLNIKNGDALLSEKEKIISKAVFGLGEKNEKKLGKGVFKNYGKGKEGFNVTSCQFAMHYFFENAIILNNFLQNIADCTKIGGYFIGCCYDGKKIFDDLINKSSGEGMTLFKNDNKIWEIIKRYDNKEFNNDDSSIGYPIDVYQETIGKMFREYLVNFDYFIRLMENYGFILLSREEAIELNIPNGTGYFNDMFSIMETQSKSKKNNAHIGEALNMTIEEKKISFYNRYFIFKKERDVGNVTIAKTKKTKINIKPKNIKKLTDRIIIKYS